MKPTFPSTHQQPLRFWVRTTKDAMNERIGQNYHFITLKCTKNIYNYARWDIERPFNHITSTPMCCSFQAERINKKAVLSQRWPRDARYISRSWAVAEIWPFEIIQDGGGRHLEFIHIENSAIRSAVREKPTLEQNMKWIGRPVAEISPLEIFPTWRWPPSWICSNRK